MKCSDAEILHEELKATVESIRQLSLAGGSKEKNYLAQYLVVYISGIYEEMIELIMTEWAYKNATLHMFNFFIEHMEQGFSNPKVENIARFLELVNPDWSKEINKFCGAERAGLFNIVENKNHIAHGRGPTVLTFKDVNDWYTASFPIIAKIDDMVL